MWTEKDLIGVIAEVRAEARAEVIRAIRHLLESMEGKPAPKPPSSVKARTPRSDRAASIRSLLEKNGPMPAAQIAAEIDGNKNATSVTLQRGEKAGRWRCDRSQTPFRWYINRDMPEESPPS